MTALSGNRETPFTGGQIARHAVEANTRIFLGSLVTLNAAGNAIPLDTTTVGQLFVGVAIEGADNRMVTPAARRVAVVQVRRVGIHELATADVLAKTNIGDSVWGDDDQTVSLTQATANAQLVGRLVRFSASDVAEVDITDAVAAALTRLTTQTIVTTYQATVQDRVILCDASGGAFTVTLPAVAAAVGVELDIKKIDATANAVTVDGSSAETIDGDLTKVLSAQWSNITVTSDGVEWFIL